MNVQSCLSVIDIVSKVDSEQTINMNNGIQNEADTTKLFITNPFAITFKNLVPNSNKVNRREDSTLYAEKE